MKTAIPAAGAFEHVLYEIEMFQWTTERLGSDEIQEGPEMTLYLECLLVHVRTLNEFFCTERKAGARHADDMKPTDFVPGYLMAKKQHPEIDRINKELAHLTYSRKPHRTGGDWYVTGTAQPIAALSLDFLHAAQSIPSLMDFGNNRLRIETLIPKLVAIRDTVWSTAELFKYAVSSPHFKGVSPNQEYDSNGSPTEG